jgi:hypothetical protein
MAKAAGRVRARKRPRSESRQRPAMLGARVTSEELAGVRRAADERGKSVSEYVRELVLTAN